MVILKYLMGKTNAIKFCSFSSNVLFFRSCILEDNLCNWSYGTCSHGNLSQNTNDLISCLKKKSNIDKNNCQCDRGYRLENKNLNDTSCILENNQTFDLMLNPRASFYLNQHGSVFAVRKFFIQNLFEIFLLAG